jgi:hypothetical protein
MHVEGLRRETIGALGIMECFTLDSAAGLHHGLLIPDALSKDEAASALGGVQASAVAVVPPTREKTILAGLPEPGGRRQAA